MDDSSSIISVPKLMQTNWKSIYIIAVVAFISSLELAVSNDWNYFCQLDSSATITFYGILRTVGGLSAGISTLIAGWMCNRLKDTRSNGGKQIAQIVKMQFDSQEKREWKASLKNP
jgi:hypothetical protein